MIDQETLRSPLCGTAQREARAKVFLTTGRARRYQTPNPHRAGKDHQQPVAAFNHFGYYPDPREIPGDLLDLPENYYSTRKRYKLRRVAGGHRAGKDGTPRDVAVGNEGKNAEGCRAASANHKPYAPTTENPWPVIKKTRRLSQTLVVPIPRRNDSRRNI
jgi:hypothetical protein